MKLLTVLEDAIKDISKDHNITKEELPELISEVLNDSLDEIIKKTRIPTPPSPFEIAIEHLRTANKRYGEHYRKTHKQINYYLWYLLYNAKMQLTESAKTSFYDTTYVDGFTKKETYSYTTSNSDFSSHEVYLSDSARLSPSSNDIVYFDLSPEVEQSISADTVTAKFISKIEQSCRTVVENLSVSPTFTMYQKTDVEIPTWKTLNLEITLPDAPIEFVMKFWKTLRNHVDLAIDEISVKDNDEEQKLAELKRSFYIQVKK